MKFFKCAAYVLFFLGISNLAFNCYMFRELKEPNIIVAPHPELKAINEIETIRDTQIMQGILMLHHQAGIHPPGKQKMCPLCDKHNQLKSVIVQKEQ